MRSLFRIAWLFFILTALTWAQPRPLSGAELMEKLESSERDYEITEGRIPGFEDEDYLSLYWPLVRERIGAPWVSEGQVRSFPVQNERTGVLIHRAIEALKQEDFDSAIHAYQEAVEVEPEFYLAHANLGDCYYRKGDYEKAISLYDKGLSMNPYDHSIHFFKADALFALGRTEEALQSYLEALTLFPRYRVALNNMKLHQKELGVKIYDEPFVPKIGVREESGTYKIYIDGGAEGPGWLAYGLAKALWRTSPSHRKEMLEGEYPDGWSLVEELQCLAVMLDTYPKLAEVNKVQDPQLERLTEIAKAGYLREFVLYQIASRMDRHIMLKFEDRSRVKDFIRKFVVVSTAE